jgi:hypothetical protein
MNEDNKGEYILYAIANNGEGNVMEVGRYEDPEDIEIFTSIFGPDVKLEIHYDYKNKKGETE